MDGEAIYKRFWLIPKDPFPEVPAVDIPQKKECCSEYMLLALADTGSDDALKNDEYGPVWQLPAIANGATLKLIKNGTDLVNLTTGTIIATSAPVSLGTLTDFGDYINPDGNPIVGYQLKWKNVLTTFGPGKYKVSITITSAIGGVSHTYYGPDFCLYQYSRYRADGTVRLEYKNSGINGDPKFDPYTINLGSLNWYNSYRLKGNFGQFQPKYEGNYTQYNSGEFKYVNIKMVPEFTLDLRPQPFFVHQILSVEAMMADELQITDYNGLNSYNYVLKGVYDGSYEIDYQYHMQTSFHPSTAKFKQRINNFRKLRDS